MTAQAALLDVPYPSSPLAEVNCPFPMNSRKGQVLCASFFRVLPNILQGRHRAQRLYSLMNFVGNIATDWPTIYLVVCMRLGNYITFSCDVSVYTCVVSQVIGIFGWSRLQIAIIHVSNLPGLSFCLFRLFAGNGLERAETVLVKLGCDILKYHFKKVWSSASSIKKSREFCPQIYMCSFCVSRA